MATIGQIIKNERTKKGLTQEELGKYLGIQKSAVAKMENGRTESVKRSQIEIMARLFGVRPAYLMGLEDEVSKKTAAPRAVRIPVLGRIVAGIPIEAIEDVLGYEDIAAKQAATGEFFALKVKGDSMLPEIKSGDVVIVKQQAEVENGDTAIVLINGDEATVKRVQKTAAGLTLIAYNPNVYEPHFYCREDVINLPVTIIGKVVQVRRDL